MAPLHGAFPLAKRNDAAVSVGENLDFDVMGPVEIFFQVKTVVTESVQGFGRGIAECGFEFGVVVNEAHALSAATGDGLQKNGVAHAVRQGLRFAWIFDGVVRPGNHGNVRAVGKLAAGSLGAERFHGLGWRPDEGEARVRAGTRQRGVFREKSITRMERIATGAPRHVHELINREVAFTRGRRADGVSFIGEANVERLAVDITEDRDGANAKLAAGAQDAHGDFTAIGDQDFLEHSKDYSELRV